MSTKLHDFAHQAILGAGLTPRANTTTVTGSAVDLITGDGRCFAIQQVGTVSGTTPTLAGKIQESADGSTGWADISGATFSAVSAADNIQAIGFDRSQRFVRYIGTIGGTTPSFTIGVLISEQKKQV
jgi:hypothetical protein